MKNLVKELETQGIIPEGKYVAAFKESEMPNSYIVETADGKVGLYKVNPTRIISPGFNKIERDENGNYVCMGMKNGKAFLEVYDKDLMPVKLETEGVISCAKSAKKAELHGVGIIKDGKLLGLCNSSCIIFPKYLRIDLSTTGKFVCYFQEEGKLCKEVYDSALNPVKETEKTLSGETTSVWAMADGTTFVGANQDGVIKKAYYLA